MNIYDYLSYREFLRDAVKKKKAENPNFSFRFIAQGLKLKSPTFFNWVLQGKKKLSNSLAHRVADLFKMSTKEKAFFMLLVQYANAKTQAEKAFYFDQIIAIRIKKLSTVNPNQYAYYGEWYHSAIREILAVAPFSGDYKELASKLRPRISAKKAKASIEILEKLNLIKKTPKGTVTAGNALLSTGDTWESDIIDNFQSDLLGFGKKAFDEIDKKERDVSNVFAGLSQENFKKVRLKIKELRHYILSLSQDDKDIEKIFLCNIQFFPITHTLEN
jgi:uncharacterized protein (TIGR02147 family)